ncbi:hypothetical protein EDB81DRAFT_308588 [Dactylonectria macrodidyma]|uniref:BZIP domain-containing protein n=1 Tax=Dactylonectria macrodidyma TaxID=307937 RepID=A0A9P9D6K3_9HYPO|nr:hypothetical protein EDB81DRAFT_308588 [Dactylonectria macrodidyma]
MSQNLRTTSQATFVYPEDTLRRRRLERNLIAATKCRIRKRDEASKLASQEVVDMITISALTRGVNSRVNAVHSLCSELCYRVASRRITSSFRRK